MLKIGISFLALLSILFLLSSCQHLVDAKMVIGQWSVRKDSSEMKVTFTPDSVLIAYRPDNTRYAYAYQWKQDESPGMIECYKEVFLDSAHRARKIIPSVMYVLRVSADSLSLLIPKLKTRFELRRVDSPRP